MAIAIDFPMFDTTDPKLSKSASSLESALAQFHKNAAPLAGATDNSTNDIFTPASGQDGSGFDEWLAADLQFGTLTGDDASSLTSSPYSALDDSPILGFESFADVNPSLFDMPLAFGNEFLAPTSPIATAAAPLPSPVKPAPVVASPSPVATPLLTTAAVQQAAAALNIPWSRDLELAVMAQAASNTPVLPAAVIPKVEPVEQAFNLVAPVAHTPMLSAASMAVSLSETRPKCNKRRALSPEEELDEIVAKRAKNTDAARRSRMKKLIRLEGLEAKVSDLETAHTKMTLKVAILETEKSNFIAKEAEQNVRIAQLEAKLAEAHAALTNRS
ncbi:hypothetical protein BGZ74_010580 [Mortierella antarctica]|nr:hypothetical protein BGZ74_010580 [Mortierella antarctica]KAG0362233.1 hypothetical protein BG005_006372 [Podila minutissima]